MRAGPPVAASRPATGLRGSVYVAPLVVVLAAVVLYPVLDNTRTAFSRYDSARDSLTFVGLDDVRTLFESTFFRDSFRALLIWVGGNVALQFVVGIGVALAVNRIRVARGLPITCWRSPPARRRPPAR